MAETVEKQANPEDDRGMRRHLVGTVTSNKMQKTCVVEVTQRFRHPAYHKYIQRRARYKAHDEQNQYQIGDVVEIAESRPLSRQKRWRVTRLVSRPERA